MALNAADISWSEILMWNTWKVGGNQTREHIVEWVSVVARGAEGGRLKNLVINCHGLPGWIGIGQGFNSSHIGMFSAWSGLIQNIWFVACLVARIPTAAYQQELNTTYPGFGTSDGNVFCSRLAQTVGAYIVAPTEVQRNRGGYAIGQLPAYEGLLMCYNPQGGVSWSQRYPSDWQANRE